MRASSQNSRLCHWVFHLFARMRRLLSYTAREIHEAVRRRRQSMCIQVSLLYRVGLTWTYAIISFSGFTLLFFILFIAFYAWQIASFVLSVFRLVDMYNFFTHLLKIPDVNRHHFLQVPRLTLLVLG